MKHLIKVFVASTLRVYAAAIVVGVSSVAFVSGARAQQSGASVRAPEVTVVLSSDTVELGDSLIYQMTIDGVSSADPPTLPRAGGAKVEFLGGHDESSRSIMTINGRTTENSVLRYIMQWRVTPAQKGAGAIEGFSFDIAGRKIEVPRVAFSVVEPQPNPNFTLTLESEAKVAYVGEPVHMRLVWLLGNNVRSAAFSGPDGGARFDVAPIDPRPPQNRGKQLVQNEPYRAVPFLNGDAVVTQSQSEFRGRMVPSITLDLVITPREPGKIEIGPYRVALDEVVGQRPSSFFDSFFEDRSKTRRSVVASNAVTLDVKPLPSEGKPDDFNGLIGVYSIDSKAGNTEANVGDPVPLTVTISGPEPLDAVKPPDLDLQSNFASEFKSSPEGWETPTSIAAAPGERTFATTIRPKSASITEIPAIRLPYFDTKTGKYSVATSKPIPLKVRAAREFTAADVARTGSATGFSLPTAISATLTSAAPGVGANSESLDALTNQRVGLLAAATSPGGLVLIVVPPLGLLVASIAAWRSRASDPRVVERRIAVRKGKRRAASAQSAPELLSAIRVALAPFVGATPQAVASSDPDESSLPANAASKARDLLQQLEGNEFAGYNVDLASAKASTRELFSMLDR
ncbi:MAG: BatD family protein [Phycisphaeraceae bacterium]|nr:BatD family protein [Phycisphaeraceae bacterium]